MSAKSWPWGVLDLPGAPATTAEVRRAYAKKLKTIDQAKDIAGFEALRKAYEAAMAKVEHKARLAAAKAAAATPTEKLTPDPELASDAEADQTAAASETSPPVPLHSADDQPTAPVVATPQSRLIAALQALADKTGPLSPGERVTKLLEDPEFQTPDLDPMLRYGMAQYIRSQYLRDALGDPYLRRSGVTADLLHDLDARFGWLSDYSAYRRDFLGDSHLFEAMIETAGLSQGDPRPVLRRRSVFVRLAEMFVGFYYVILFFVSLATLQKVSETASWIAGSRVNDAILNNILFVPVVAAFSESRTSTKRNRIRGHWVQATPYWFGLGSVCALLALTDYYWATELGLLLQFWLGISIAILMYRFGRSLLRQLVAQLRNLKRNRQA